MIVKNSKGRGYWVTSESGRKLSRRPKSKEGALRQLYAVEMSQARDRSRSGDVSKRTRRRVSAATYGRYG